MQWMTEIHGGYTLLSTAQPSPGDPGKYTATCVIKKDGKIMDRVSSVSLFDDASEANEDARRLARQRLGDWQRSA